MKRRSAPSCRARSASLGVLCGLALLGAPLPGCIPDDGPAMRPGVDCMGCHSNTAVATNGPGGVRFHHASPAWSVAGTVFNSASGDQGFEGAEVQVTDANGWSFSLRSNEAGNFYSAESPTFPIHVCLSANGAVACQESALASGSCNSCHSSAGAVGAPLVAPR